MSFLVACMAPVAPVWALNHYEAVYKDDGINHSFGVVVSNGQLAFPTSDLTVYTSPLYTPGGGLSYTVNEVVSLGVRMTPFSRVVAIEGTSNLLILAASIVGSSAPWMSIYVPGGEGPEEVNVLEAGLRPTGMAMDASGAIYIPVEEGMIYKYSASTATSRRLGREAGRWRWGRTASFTRGIAI